MGAVVDAGDTCLKEEAMGKSIVIVGVGIACRSGLIQSPAAVWSQPGQRRLGCGLCHQGRGHDYRNQPGEDHC